LPNDPNPLRVGPRLTDGLYISSTSEARTGARSYGVSAPDKQHGWHPATVPPSPGRAPPADQWRRPPRPPGPHRAHRPGARRHGQTLDPAILLADEGFRVPGSAAPTTAFHQRRLRKYDEAFRTYFHPAGTPLQPGGVGVEPDRLVQPDLARTLRALADE